MHNNINWINNAKWHSIIRGIVRLKMVPIIRPITLYYRVKIETVFSIYLIQVRLGLVDSELISNIWKQNMGK